MTWLLLQLLVTTMIMVMTCHDDDDDDDDDVRWLLWYMVLSCWLWSLCDRATLRFPEFKKNNFFITGIGLWHVCDEIWVIWQRPWGLDTVSTKPKPGHDRRILRRSASVSSGPVDFMAFQEGFRTVALTPEGVHSDIDQWNLRECAGDQNAPQQRHQNHWWIQSVSFWWCRLSFVFIVFLELRTGALSWMKSTKDQHWILDLVWRSCHQILKLRNCCWRSMHRFAIPAWVYGHVPGMQWSYM